ncbi:predicted protein, partial [Nematostella vectensis]
ATQMLRYMVFFVTVALAVTQPHHQRHHVTPPLCFSIPPPALNPHLTNQTWRICGNFDHSTFKASVVPRHISFGKAVNITATFTLGVDILAMQCEWKLVLDGIILFSGYSADVCQRHFAHVKCPILKGDTVTLHATKGIPYVSLSKGMYAFEGTCFNQDKALIGSVNANFTWIY